MKSHKTSQKNFVFAPKYSLKYVFSVSHTTTMHAYDFLTSLLFNPDRAIKRDCARSSTCVRMLSQKANKKFIFTSVAKLYFAHLLVLVRLSVQPL